MQKTFCNHVILVFTTRELEISGGKKSDKNNKPHPICYLGSNGECVTLDLRLTIILNWLFILFRRILLRRLVNYFFVGKFTLYVGQNSPINLNMNISAQFRLFSNINKSDLCKKSNFWRFDLQSRLQKLPLYCLIENDCFELLVVRNSYRIHHRVSLIVQQKLEIFIK